MVHVVHKKVNKFKRHHSDRHARVGESWRRPKGIDSVVRRKWRGQIKMANIGYGNAKATRNVHPDGLRHFNVNCEKVWSPHLPPHSAGTQAEHTHTHTHTHTHARTHAHTHRTWSFC